MNVFAIDVRSLAALRIVLALTVLADLALRAPNLRAHYSDEGLLPRQVLLQHLDPWLLSLSLSNGTPIFQGLLFAVTAAAAVGMLLGYRTWLMTAIVWVLMLSIHWRNPLVGYSADGLLRLLLFWSLFVPLGAVWSLDRRRENPPLSATRVLSVGAAGLLLQIAFMYWFTVLLKSGPQWRVDGSAISYALSMQELATPLGTWLLQFPELLRALTFLTLGIETVAPLLLFAPVWSVPLRLAGIVAIVALQAGIWLTLNVGIFPWLAASCMVAFLPSWFWDTLLPRAQTRLSWGGTAMESGQAGVDLAQLVPAGVASGMGPWVSLSPIVVTAAPSPAISSLSGSSPSSDLPDTAPTSAQQSRTAAPPAGASFLANLAAGFCLVYVLVWNVTLVSPIELNDDARALGSLLGLVQSWTMFAPYPYDSTSWYTIPGTLRDGQQIDLMPFLLHGNPHRLVPASAEKPRDMTNAFAGDERWRKYFENLHDAQNAHLLPPLGSYLCREWNTANGATPTELQTLQIISHWERTLPDNQRGPTQQLVQWNHQCSASQALSASGR